MLKYLAGAGTFELQVVAAIFLDGNATLTLIP